MKIPIFKLKFDLKSNFNLNIGIFMIYNVF